MNMYAAQIAMMAVLLILVLITLVMWGKAKEKADKYEIEAAIAKNNVVRYEEQIADLEDSLASSEKSVASQSQAIEALTGCFEILKKKEDARDKKNAQARAKRAANREAING